MSILFLTEDQSEKDTSGGCEIDCDDVNAGKRICTNHAIAFPMLKAVHCSLMCACSFHGMGVRLHCSHL